MAVIRVTKSGKAFHIVTDSPELNSYTVSIAALRKLLDPVAGSRPRAITLTRMGMDVAVGKFPLSPVFGLSLSAGNSHNDGMSKQAVRSGKQKRQSFDEVIL